MAQNAKILSRIFFQNELQRLGVWQVWESVLRFRPPTKTPERAKPLRSSNVNPHWLHPLLGHVINCNTMFYFLMLLKFFSILLTLYSFDLNISPTVVETIT